MNLKQELEERERDQLGTYPGRSSERESEIERKRQRERERERERERC